MTLHARRDRKWPETPLSERLAVCVAQGRRTNDGESRAQTPDGGCDADGPHSAVAVRIRAPRHALTSTAPQLRRQGRTTAPHEITATRARCWSPAAESAGDVEASRGGPTATLCSRAAVQLPRVPRVPITAVRRGTRVR